MSMHAQRGVVLIVSLVFLMLLTLLATSSMQNATLQEKMVGNQVLRNASFQSAESLLRSGEARLPAAGRGLPKCSSPARCLPPPEALTLKTPGEHGASGVKWQAGKGGLFGIQYLGNTDDAVDVGPPQTQSLYRVTAIGIKGTSRTVLESVHTDDRRIMWRQRQ